MKLKGGAAQCRHGTCRNPECCILVTRQETAALQAGKSFTACKCGWDPELASQLSYPPTVVNGLLLCLVSCRKRCHTKVIFPNPTCLQSFSCHLAPNHTGMPLPPRHLPLIQPPTSHQHLSISCCCLVVIVSGSFGTHRL